MPTALPRTPSYRLHKPSGQAVVTIDGRDFYLGRHDSPESRAEYDRLLAEWLAGGRRLPTGPAASDLSINEVLLAYLRHADAYYMKDGKPTTEPVNLRLALRPVRQLYGHKFARDFGPLALKTVRQSMIDAGLCRNEVNKRIRRVVRCFKWAVSEEMIPATVHQGLCTVAGLRKGRADVRESDPVKPAPDEQVDAILPHLAPQLRAMVEVQRLTGMRPGEVCGLVTGEIDRSGAVWVYTPASHKTQHHGRSRTIFIGPKAQAILAPWLRADPDAPLFQPREVMAEFRAGQRAARKTPVQPSQVNRKKRGRPRKAPGERYTPDSYRETIIRACDKAGVPRWHPNQLRHTAATKIRKEFGLDTARAVLGHSSPTITETYAEIYMSKAAEAMEKIG